MRRRFARSAKRRGLSVLTAATSAAGALMGLAAPAAAQQVLLQSPAARVSLEPIAADATLGGRAQLAASLGAIDTSLTAAIERGGGQLSSADAAWTSVVRPASWTGDDLQFAARWALPGGAKMSLEAGDRERRTRSFIDPLGYSADEQLAVDQAQFFRLHLSAEAGPTNLQAGAETSTTAVDALNSSDPSGAATRLWITSRRVFGQLAWRPSPLLSFEAGQTAQTFNVGWRGADALESQSAYLTPNLALVLTPSSRAIWKLDVEETVTPVDPAKFAAYAQLATPGGDAAPQPDRGWRYGLSLERHLPGGVKLSARATRWRLVSVTDLGPVGAGEAPIGIGQGGRRQLDLNLAAPLSGMGLPGATLAGEVSWRRSQVLDPFTGARRPISGETPYRAQLQLSGALPTSPLTWSVIAKADGPQSLYQMSKVTNLGATTGIDGALRYDAGQVLLSLELDNLVGRGREVTTSTWSGGRTNGAAPTEVDRRDDDARAVRISLRRPL